MRPLIFLISFFFVTIPANSQTKKIDSLRLVLKTTIADTTRIDILTGIGNRFQSLDPDTAIYFHLQAISLANKVGDGLREAEAVRRLGWDNYTLGNFEKALSLYNQSLELTEMYIPKGSEKNFAQTKTIKAKKAQAPIFVCIGIIYSSQGNNARAIEYYLRALNIQEKFEMQKAIPGTLNSIAAIYNDQADYPRALEYNMRALKMDEKAGDKTGIVADLGNIGNIYSEQKNTSKALEYYFKALEVAFPLGNKNHMATLLGNIGAVYELKGENLKALEYFSKALELEKELGRKQRISSITSNIGNAYISIGKYKEAEKELQSALEISTDLNLLALMSAQHKSFSELYDSMKLHQKAFEHYKKYIAVRDTINSEENQKKQVRTEMNYEFDKKEAVMVEQREKEKALAEEQNRKQQIVILSVALGLLFVIIFAGFVVRSLKTTRHQKQIIEEKQKEILDSIRYAKRIQQSLLPNEKYIARCLNRREGITRSL